jgi:hypothetical protein
MEMAEKIVGTFANKGKILVLGKKSERSSWWPENCTIMIVRIGRGARQYAAHHFVAVAQISKDDALRCLAILQYLTLLAQIHKRKLGPGR